MSENQREEFKAQFKSVLQLLQQISNVWNLSDPCVIAGFDMDRVGTVQVGTRHVLWDMCKLSVVWLGILQEFLFSVEGVYVLCDFLCILIVCSQALSMEPAGTFIVRFSMSQPGCLVLTCKTMPGHPLIDKDNLLHAIIKVGNGSNRI